MTPWLYMPPWGIRAVVLTGAVLLALVAVRALRERRLAGLRKQAVALVLRCVAIAALLWVALNPTALKPRKAEGKPVLSVLVDCSSSMSIDDVEGASRHAAALKVLSDDGALARLADDFELRVALFDKDTRATSLADLAASTASGTASELGAALTTTVNDVADEAARAGKATAAARAAGADNPLVGGVLVVSDGQSTGEGALDAARLALARSVPLWTWCLGGAVPRRDLWIEVPSSEVLAFSGAEVELAATLRQVGYSTGSFLVELLNEGEVIQTINVDADGSDEFPLRATVTAPGAGEHRYVFRMRHDKDEAEAGNNERSVFLRVVGEKVRVLLAEGQPHWDTKFLVQCLKASPRVELTAIYRISPQRQFAVVSAGGEQRREERDLFPRSADEFAQYDVIILGRGCEAFFGEHTEEYLTDFVARHGGGLVFSRGQPYGGRFAPLAKLEPVIWGTGVMEGVRFAPTRQGRSSPVFELATTTEMEDLLEKLPPFDQAARTVGVKPLAVVLAEARSAGGETGEEAIMMAYHHYGQGRVVTLNVSGLWRWAFREKGTPDEEVVYERFWNAMLRWLLSGSDFLAGADVALRSERRLYTDEQQMRFLIRTRGLEEDRYRPKLVVRGAGVEAELEPRPQSGATYIAEAGPFPPGTYDVTLRNNIGSPSEMTMTVEVVSGSIENRVLSADPELMRRLAEVSNGQALTARDVPRLGGLVRTWQAKQELAEQKAAMWDHWALLAAMLIVLGVEWFLRRRGGLL